MPLQTMYAGMVNSPETTITNSLGPADTTIYVLDPSRVPEPLPNLMTLGTGTNAETVLVTSLSDNALTVVRGYQGIAKDWLPGTIIARNFTEYDHAAFKANITDLGTAVDDLAGSSIRANITTPGNPIATATKATDIAVVNLKGATQITKPNPEADTSPDNIAAITGIVNPTITATSGGQSNSQQISGELYRLPDGTKDEYDGQAGKLTKRVGKLVLTGTEDWAPTNNPPAIGINVIRMALEGNKLPNKPLPSADMISTHLPKGRAEDEVNSVLIIPNTAIWMNLDKALVGYTEGDTANQVVAKGKAWLAAQAAASTPITIYYEMAVPQVTEIRHDLTCYADSTTFACADPLATDMSVTVLDGRMVGRSRDAEFLAGLHPSTYRQSNRNLLDNWDFRRPVNQRGVSGAISTNSYALDRWVFYFPGGAGTGSVLIQDGYITFDATGRARFDQYYHTVLPPGVYTASVLKTDGTILAETVSWAGSGNSNIVWFESGFSFSISSVSGPSSATNTTLLFDSRDGHTANIAAVKLELGPVSTLALDPPADYGETLRKCLRYYVSSTYLAPSFATAQYANGVTIPIAFPVPIRARPTLIVGDLTDCLRIAMDTNLTPTSAAVDDNFSWLSDNPSFGGCAIGFALDTVVGKVYGYKPFSNAIAFSAEPA